MKTLRYYADVHLKSGNVSVRKRRSSVSRVFSAYCAIHLPPILRRSSLSGPLTRCSLVDPFYLGEIKACQGQVMGRNWQSLLCRYADHYFPGGQFKFMGVPNSDSKNIGYFSKEREKCLIHLKDGIYIALNIFILLGDLGSLTWS